MTFSDLCKLLEEQEKIYENWKNDLIAGAMKLKSHIEVDIELKDKEFTDNSGVVRQFVEILNIHENPPTPENFEKSINELGELIVGISIAFNFSKFDPQRYSYLPIALRFSKRKLQYSLLDIDNLEEKDWQEDINLVSQSIILAFQEWFSFDPYDGFEERSPKQIGFLKPYK